MTQPSKARFRHLAGVAMLAALAACGGGGGPAGTPMLNDPTPVAADQCATGSRKAALREYFDDWYFWYGISPKPDPGNAASLLGYFDSLLYTGTDPAFPADRWSFVSSTDAFEQFFTEGQTLGYGVSVNGLEVSGRPDLPLLVRYVDPLSPAALAGVVRGDRIVSANGKPGADLIRSGDFSLLSPGAAGETLVLQLAGAGGQRTVTLTAVDYALVPVTLARVVTSPQGRRVGYLLVKDMVSQAVQPATDAMAEFRTAGVTELVLDLRYNGGGLVSVGRDIASLIAGSRGAGRTYASLLYNDRKAAEFNTTYRFTDPPQGGLGLQRVYILVGERTCSASEQLANGLLGVVDVVLVGGTTCGKPVGFNSVDDGCGATYSVVNFESVNAVNQGRYFDGLRPTCAATEDFAQALGTVAEPLLSVALSHADGGGCVAPAAGPRSRALSATLRRALAGEGQRPMMLPR
ncbi:S41 family peptidase [Ideonella sp. A 288]|uniref:S41 family peptidase n=1 Tax=Ideonella sp. A 288 TaxID=1962181 RepID=UPI000B4AEBDA|nr:S41 family peptidase [Ideonella sp. A 288]